MVGVMGSEHLSSPSQASVPCPHAFCGEGAGAGVWVHISFSFFLIYPKELPTGHLSLPLHLVKQNSSAHVIMTSWGNFNRKSLS